MADLSDLQSATTIKIVGANSSGVETNFTTVGPDGSVLVQETEPATFSVVSVATTVAFNKSMIAIGNITVSKVKIHRIQITNVQTAAATGLIGIFELRKVLASSGGTALTPFMFDSSKTLPVGINAATNVTISSEGPIIKRWLWSTDEWGTGTLDQEGLDHANQSNSYAFSSDGRSGPIVLNQNEGIHIKQTANGSAGTFDLYIEFSVG